jgi:hypothetical protein
MWCSCSCRLALAQEDVPVAERGVIANERVAEDAADDGAVLPVLLRRAIATAGARKRSPGEVELRRIVQAQALGRERSGRRCSGLLCLCGRGSSRRRRGRPPGLGRSDPLDTEAGLPRVRWSPCTYRAGSRDRPCRRHRRSRNGRSRRFASTGTGSGSTSIGLPWGPFLASLCVRGNEWEGHRRTHACLR